MYVSECKVQRHKTILLHQPLRQRLLLLTEPPLKRRLHHLVHHLACDAGILQLLRARIHSGQSSGHSRAALCSMAVAPALSRLGTCRNIVHLRMHDVQPSVESRRLSEKYELGSRLQLLMHPLDALEEDHLHLSASVADPYAHPLAVMDIHALHPGPHLHEGHVGTRIRYPDKAAPVYVSEREDPQKLSDRAHLKLLPQKLGPLRPHSRKKLYLHI